MLVRRFEIVVAAGRYPYWCQTSRRRFRLLRIRLVRIIFAWNLRTVETLWQEQMAFCEEGMIRR